MHAGTRRFRTVVGSVVVAVPALVLLALHAQRYWPFIADDALISLRYSQRLLDGHGLTWTDGQPVEGYSNLLWVLGCALLGALSIDLVDAARVLGGLGMGCALVCIAAWERDGGWRGRTSGAVAAVAIALVGGMAVWAIGGLEQPMVAGLLALGVLLARPLAEPQPSARTWPAALALALLCLTRPDGALLAGLVGLGLSLARGVSRQSVRMVLGLGVPSVLAVLGQLTFRLLYYGDYVPNTAHAKLALTSERLNSGLEYVLDAGTWSWPLVVLALPAVFRPRRIAWLPVVPLLGWLVYVVFIGGDIFPGRRHMVPAAVCLGFVIATGLTAPTRKRVWPAVVLSVVMLGWQVDLTQRDPANHHAIGERWEWDGEVVGRLLGSAFRREQPLLAVDPAGCLPYFSELPSLDMMGLNDRYLATHPPADFGRGWLGHELGDGEYVWSRQPDLILMCLPSNAGMGACFRSGRELLARPDFRASYSLIEFEGREPRTVRSSVWVRRDGRVGMQREEGRLAVPGHLLTGREVLAVLDDRGRMGAAVPPHASAHVRLPEVFAQGRVVRVESDGEPTVNVERGRLRVVTESAAAHVRAVWLDLRTGSE